MAAALQNMNLPEEGGGVIGKTLREARDRQQSITPQTGTKTAKSSVVFTPKMEELMSLFEKGAAVDPRVNNFGLYQLLKAGKQQELAASQAGEEGTLAARAGVSSLSTPEMANRLAQMGRYDDDQIAHVAEGEMLVPAPILKYYPEVREEIFDVIKKEGLNPQEFIVGGDMVARNPLTGIQEFGFLSKVFKKIKKVVKKLAPVILAVALPGIGSALGTSAFGYASLGQAALTGAAAGGLGTLIQGGNFKDALRGAAIGGLTAGIFKGAGNKLAGRGFFDSGVIADASTSASTLPESLQGSGRNIAPRPPVGQFGADAGPVPFEVMEQFNATSGARPLELTTGAGSGLGSGTTTVSGGGLTQTSAATQALADSATAGSQNITETLAGTGLPDATNLKSLPQPSLPPPPPPATDPTLFQKFRTGIGNLNPFKAPPSIKEQILNAGIPNMTPDTLEAAIQSGMNRGLSEELALAEYAKGLETLELFKPAASVGDKLMYTGLVGLTAAPLLFTPEEEMVDPETGEPLTEEERNALFGLGGDPAIGQQGFDFVDAYRRRQNYEGVGSLPMYAAEGGEIAGPGTGTSDSIPALLSDGEFVMTAEAVRNAGGGSRRKGAAKMYKLMRELEAV